MLIIICLAGEVPLHGTGFRVQNYDFSANCARTCLAELKEIYF